MTPTIVQEEQVVELEDVRVCDPLLALDLEIIGSKPQNLKNILEVVNGRK